MTSKNSRYLTVKCWIFRRTFYFVVCFYLAQVAAYEIDYFEILMCFRPTEVIT